MYANSSTIRTRVPKSLGKLMYSLTNISTPPLSAPNPVAKGGGLCKGSTPLPCEKNSSYRNLNYNYNTTDGLSESTRRRAYDVEKSTDKASLAHDRYTDCDMECANYV